MPIVQAGKTFTKEDLKWAVGAQVAKLRDDFQQAEQIRLQLASFPDADLIALGMTQAEVNAIKGFFVGDFPAVRTAFLASSWLAQLLGVGV